MYLSCAQCLNGVGKRKEEERKIEGWKHPFERVRKGKLHSLVLHANLLKWSHRC